MTRLRRELSSLAERTRVAKEEEKRHQEEKQQLSTTIALLNRRLEDGNMLVARIERSNKKRRARLQMNMDHVRQITSYKLFPF